MITYMRPQDATLYHKWMPVMDSLERNFSGGDDMISPAQAVLLLIVLYADDLSQGVPDDPRLQETFAWFKPYGADVVSIVNAQDPVSIFAAADEVTALVPLEVLHGVLMPASEKH